MDLKKFDAECLEIVALGMKQVKRHLASGKLAPQDLDCLSATVQRIQRLVEDINKSGKQF